MLKRRDNGIKQEQILQLVKVVEHDFKNVLDEVNTEYVRGWKRSIFKDSATRATSVSIYTTTPEALSSIHDLFTRCFSHEDFKIKFSITHYTFSASGKKVPKLLCGLYIDNFEFANEI